ncbi:hypothetical protein G3I62_20810, partial [Streptomyces sp. SID14446]|nr:hypothetical protein [Streptomyces sp. SID14446]
THGGLRAGTGADPGPGPTTPAAPARPGEAGPLRRRVRGATLSATTASTRLPKTREAVTHRRPPSWQPTDAEAARAELDEFEEAVQRAQRESETGEHPVWAFRPDDGPGGPAGPDTLNRRPSSPEGMST